MPTSLVSRATISGHLDDYDVLNDQHGPTLPPLLAGRPPLPEELAARAPESDVVTGTVATGTVATDAETSDVGRRLVIDLRGQDYHHSRQLLSEGLRTLGSADTLLVISSDDLRSLRFEMEATLPQVYRWCLHVALPVDDPTEFTTVVERI